MNVEDATVAGTEPPGDPTKRFANMRVLWSFVRPHRWTLLTAFVLTVITTGTTLATPMATKGILDGLADDATIAGAIWVLVALLAIGSVVGWFRLIMLGRLAEEIVLDARVGMVQRLLHVPVGGLGRRSPGELVTRVTSDTLLLREAASSTALEFFSSMVMVTGSLVLMATLDWVLLLVMFVTIIVVAGTIGLVMRPLAAAQQEAQAAIGRLGGALEGAMRAIRTVKASRAEEWENDRIIDEAKESFRQRMRAVRIEALTWTLTGVGFQGAILVILGVGAWRVSLGELTVSGLVAFLLYAFLVVDPMTQLSQSVSLLQSGLAASARIREIQVLPVEDTRTAPERSASPVVGSGSPVLTFRGVHARYAPGAPRALNGVDLDIARRGHTAVVGPSGAGKTTLFSLVLRFLEPESGSVSLDGVPLGQYALAELRERIVYVEQDTPLVPGTLRQNLLYTHPHVDEEALWAVLRDVRLDERVRSLENGLDTPLDGSVISGGERQRIALARALVGEPEILLLDEATAQLDGLTETAIHDAVERVASRGAVITIAHRLSTVVDADQILVMEDGLCRATGTHDELLAADDLYRDLVAALRIATGGQGRRREDAAVPG